MHLRIGIEIIGYLFFRNESIRVAREIHVWKAIVPSGTICNQRIPTHRPPTLGNPSSFEDDMLHAAFGKMLAHSHTSLPGPDDKRVDYLN